MNGEYHFNKYPAWNIDDDYLINTAKEDDIFMSLIEIGKIKNNLLDVGCGTGKCLKYLELIGKKDLTGIDLSEVSIGIAKKKLKHSKLFVMNAERLKLKDNSFNTIICHGVAHHSKNPEKVFKECVRVCKKNGMILFSFARKYSFHYYERMLFRPIVKAMFKLNIHRFFIPLFRFYLQILSGSNYRIKLTDDIVIRRIADSYINPIVHFKTEKELRELVKQNNLNISKFAYAGNRRSMISLLIYKKRN